MKYTSKIFILLFVTFTLLYAGARIENFTAQSDGDNIVLTWNSFEEPNVKHYEILRGSGKDVLSYLNTVAAKGDNSIYTFVDESAYKVSSSVYKYALVIVYNDGSRSDPMYTPGSVLHDGVSGVKRTWGSIKALFR